MQSAHLKQFITAKGMHIMQIKNLELSSDMLQHILSQSIHEEFFALRISDWFTSADVNGNRNLVCLFGYLEINWKIV
jgi:hypothetical protein